MKILYVITKSNWGGAQRYVFDLIEAAHNEGHSPALAFGERGLLAERAEALGIPLYPIEGLSRDLATGDEVAAFKSLFAVMRDMRPDVVHVNSSKGGLALLAARTAKVPRIVFTAHGWAFNEERPWWQRYMLRAIYAITVLLSHVTICVSEAIRKDLAGVPKEKVRVIYNGIDAPEFKTRPDARNALLPNAKAPIWLGMITELHRSKRVGDAIDALYDLKDDYPDLALVVLGEGSERQMLEERVRARGLVGRVFLCGFVPDAASYLPAFDIFLMPSKTEALAYALIEAGYAGLPVIASRVGGIPEIVTHAKTGLLVPPKNPHVLARTIRRFLHGTEDGAALGSALKESVTAQFSREKMVRETFALY